MHLQMVNKTETVDELFTKINITQESFGLAYGKLTNKASVVLQ